MAGDVTVSVLAGPGPIGNSILSVVGDSQSNEIRIVETGFDSVRIEGLNGTTLNGQSSVDVSAFPETALERSEIVLGNGDDQLIYQMNHFVTRSVDMGNGDDKVTIEADFASGSVSVDTGNGNDEVNIQAIDAALAFLPSVVIDAGNGSDTLRFDDADFRVYGNRFSADLGNGNDHLIGGDGPSSFPSIYFGISGGRGFDTVTNADYFGSWDLGLFGFEQVDDDEEE